MSRARKVATEPPELGLVLAILSDHVSTPRGLCAGEAPAWDRDRLPGEDETGHVERVRRAVAACRVCPARTRCPAPLRNVPRTG